MKSLYMLNIVILKNLNLNEKTLLDLINIIRDTIDMIISLKVDKISEKKINFKYFII